MNRGKRSNALMEEEWMQRKTPLVQERDAMLCGDMCLRKRSPFLATLLKVPGQHIIFFGGKPQTTVFDKFVACRWMEEEGKGGWTKTKGCHDQTSMLPRM